MENCLESDRYEPGIKNLEDIAPTKADMFNAETPVETKLKNIELLLVLSGYAIISPLMFRSYDDVGDIERCAACDEEGER